MYRFRWLAACERFADKGLRRGGVKAGVATGAIRRSMKLTVLK